MAHGSILVSLRASNTDLKALTHSMQKQRHVTEAGRSRGIRAIWRLHWIYGMGFWLLDFWIQCFWLLDAY